MARVLDRPTPTVVKYFAATVLSSHFSVFQNQLALKGSTSGVGPSSVVIDMTQMKPAGLGGVQAQSTWSFPPPANQIAHPVNYFVGENTAQTLANKQFDRITASTVIVESFLASTHGSPQLGFGSTNVPGMVKISFTTAVANGLAWTMTIPGMTTASWLVLTPANQAAAALTGAQQVYVDHFKGGGGPPRGQFNCYMGPTPLATGVTYAWVYHIINSPI